ncbi:hypothetical protein [Paraburkholderia sp. GAS334]|jgi:hypothetical protein
MPRLRTIVISDDVIQLYVPVTLLTSHTLVHDATGWHMATILPVANTQLK